MIKIVMKVGIIMRKVLTLFLAAILFATVFTACGNNEGSIIDDNNNISSSGNTEKVETQTIRFLNFKPEIATIYDKIAEQYETETGNKIIVETAANNTYEQTLSAKMATDEAPTIFQINGPRGYSNWKDYCADLTDSEIYNHLTDKSIAITVDDKVYGIPYTIEGYGIIYNNAIMKKYFEMADKSTEYNSMDEIKNFESLKAVVEDMQKNSDKLGIKGVFACTSLKAGDDWRWQTHLANIPIYYEFKNNNIDLTSDATKEITFEYGDQYKNIFDLYTNNSTTDKKMLGSKIVDESMAEFALGECAMVQNGNWAWEQISSVTGNTVKAEDIKYMPIYTGVEGEEGQGLCVGTENFFCVNSNATEAEQQTAKDFIYWLYSSDTGKNFVTNELKFIAPFDTFTDEEKPTDPLSNEVLEWMSKEGITSVPWNFTLFPSQIFKDNVGSALLQYAQGTKTWDDVKKIVVEDWKSESNILE